MSKKTFYDEQGNAMRSRPSKPIYQKWWFWLSMVLGLIFGTIGIYALGSADETSNEPEEQEEQYTTEEIEEVEEMAEEEPEPVEEKEEIVEESTFTYEDFKGTYVTFEGQPYNSSLTSIESNIKVIGDDFYQSFNRWDFDMTSTILDKKVEGNILTLHLDSAESEVWGLHSESGIEQFELLHDGDKKILHSITHDYSFYSMSNQDLQNHYGQLEIDYARIIMTIMGKPPSLDQWAMWTSELGDPSVYVGQSVAGDPTELSAKVSYPEDVTHLSVSLSTMAESFFITYFPHGDGHITRYPFPSHYHQEDQSEEGYRQLAQEVLDDAFTLYVEPFDPYIVADFIGRIEFVYE